MEHVSRFSCRPWVIEPRHLLKSRRDRFEPLSGYHLRAGPLPRAPQRATLFEWFIGCPSPSACHSLQVQANPDLNRRLISFSGSSPCGPHYHDQRGLRLRLPKAVRRTNWSHMGHTAIHHGVLPSCPLPATRFRRARRVRNLLPDEESASGSSGATRFPFNRLLRGVSVLKSTRMPRSIDAPVSFRQGRPPCRTAVGPPVWSFVVVTWPVISPPPSTRAVLRPFTAAGKRQSRTASSTQRA